MATPTKPEVFYPRPVDPAVLQTVEEMRREAFALCEVILSDATRGEAATLKFAVERMLTARAQRSAAA